MKAKTKIVGTSLVVGAVTLAVGGAYIVGSMSDDDSQTLTNSHAKQLVAEQQFKDLEAERFVNTVEQQTELVLTTESGIANLKVSKHSDSWNKWLTRSEAEFGLEYKAKVSIKTQDLIFMNKEGGMVVIFDRDESGKIAMKDLVGHGNRDDNKTYRQNNWYYLMLPKTKEHSSTDFTIEDYFPILYKQHIVHEKLNATNWAFKELPTDLRQNIKDALGKHIDKYQENHLAQFSVLLDKIINILNGTDADIEEI